MAELERIEIVTGDDPQYSVIWLHGLGADGHDFEPIVPHLVKPHWPAIRFIFPHAPVQPVTINGGMRMRAWYDILGLEIANRQDERGVRASVDLLYGLIADEAERGIPESRIFLIGFSQGGAIVLATAVRFRALAGVAALSTYLPLADRTDAEMTAESRKTPVFMGHGSMDPTVPHALGQMSKGVLEKAGYAVEWHSYPMPHSVSDAEIADLSAWMARQFGRR